MLHCATMLSFKYCTVVGEHFCRVASHTEAADVPVYPATSCSSHLQAAHHTSTMCWSLTADLWWTSPCITLSEVMSPPVFHFILGRQNLFVCLSALLVHCGAAESKFGFIFELFLQIWLNSSHYCCCFGASFYVCVCIYSFNVHIMNVFNVILNISVIYFTNICSK